MRIHKAEKERERENSEQTKDNTEEKQEGG